MPGQRGHSVLASGTAQHEVWAHASMHRRPTNQGRCMPQRVSCCIMLRETLCCTLPVEVAWQGPQEMDDRTLAALQDRFGPLRGFDVQAMPYPAHMRL
jgi:hypothetical protein